jgi:hypothetical protein
MQPGGQNELHLVATRLNKLTIIFYMNIIFQYFSITLFSIKTTFKPQFQKDNTHVPIVSKRNIKLEITL